MKQHIMALLENDEKRQTALQYWKDAISPYIRETDNIDLIRKCLSKRTWTDKQARYMHELACRAYGPAEQP